MYDAVLRVDTKTNTLVIVVDHLKVFCSVPATKTHSVDTHSTGPLDRRASQQEPVWSPATGSW
jgi:hypothetical protein